MFCLHCNTFVLLVLRTQERKPDEDKLKDQSDEATPKILSQVAENWGKRCHNIGNRLVKYYHDPSTSTGKCYQVIPSVLTIQYYSR